MAVYDITPNGGGDFFSFENPTYISTLKVASNYALTISRDGKWNGDGSVLFLCTTNGLAIINCSSAYNPLTGVMERIVQFPFLRSLPTTNTIRGIHFSHSGTKMYVMDSSNFIHRVDLDTAYDPLSYATSTLQSFNLSSLHSSLIGGLMFKSDGTKLLTLGSSGIMVQFALSSGFDITTITLTGTKDISAQDSAMVSFFTNPTGSKLLIVGTTDDVVYEYSMTDFTISGLTLVDSFDVTTQEALPQFILPDDDGNRLYVMGSGSDVFQWYDLPSAYDLTSIAHNSAGSVVSGMSIRKIKWANAGSKLYVAGVVSAVEYIYEYTAATPYRLTSCSYVGSLNIDAYISNLTDFEVNAAGTKVLILDSTADDITEVTLSTPWQISSGTATDTFSVTTQESSPIAMLVDPADGTSMYVVGDSTDNLQKYTVGTGFDLTGCAFSKQVVLGLGNLNADFIYWIDSGQKMLIGVDTGQMYLATLKTAYNPEIWTEFRVIAKNKGILNLSDVTLTPTGDRALLFSTTGYIDEYSLV